MIPPKSTACCPICEFEFAYLGKHLASRHSVVNKAEKRLLLNHATGRVNYRHLPCPVPGCGFSKSRVDRHLKEQGHPELDKAQVQEFVKDIKRKVTMDGLRALRASNPTPPMMSSLDLDQDEDELIHDVSDAAESSNPFCSTCTKLAADNKVLWRQIRIKKRWAKKAKAKIKSLEEARNVLLPEKRSKVSKSMCHDTATAEKFYALHQSTEQLAELRKKFLQATDPDAQGCSETEEPRLLTLSESSSEDEGKEPLEKKRL
ncbi:uncharacterized protein LOC116720312 [Xiphophorus hellerii]|uniref:uncharacterized protein LOC116720312 n=1 Tax=Xiphophorus hellerii TaxID=8084 RepID=UPI0013B404C4|nr:uncharacterized protein LOC116720312 [Xiphophorus hellerii]